MKLLRYEFKKLIGARYVFVLIAIILVLNATLLMVQTENTGAYDTDLLIRGHQDYLSDPAAFRDYKVQVETFLAEQDRLSLEAMLNHEEYVTVEKQWRYTGTSASSEADFLEMILEAAKETIGYHADLRSFIDQNKAKLKEYDAQGMDRNDFLYRYTEYTIEMYEKHLKRNVGIGFEYVHGWDTYFSYDEGNLLTFLSILAAVCAVMLVDKSGGFFAIMSVSKKGRRQSLWAKLGLCALLSGGISLAVSLVNFAVCAWRLGLSSPFNVIQAISDFRYMPFDMSVWEYFLLFIFIKMLVCMVFGLVMAAFGTVFNSYVYTYLAGAGFVCMNLFLHVYDSMQTFGFGKVNNLVSLFSVNHLFTRIYAFPLFGNVIDNRICLAVLLCLTVAGAIVTVLCLYHRRGMVAKGRVAKALRKFIPKTETRRKKTFKKYSDSLFQYEIYKTVGSLFALVAIVICTVGSYQTSLKRYQGDGTYFEATYNTYMDALSGVANADSDAYILAENDRLQEILAKKQTMQQAYAEGTITREAYSAYMDTYYKAEAQMEVFRHVTERQYYIHNYTMRFQKQLWYLHDLGYEQFFSADFNAYLYVLLLVLIAGNFAGEYETNSKGSSFYAVMSCTKRGRAYTFWTKYGCSALIATVLFCLYQGIELYFFGKSYGFSELSAPLASLTSFSYLPWQITIGEYIVLNTALQYVGVLMLTGLINAISVLTKKLIPTLTASILLTILPHGCVLMGADILEMLDFTSILNSHSLLQYSLGIDADFLYGAGVYWILIGGWFLLTALLVWRAYCAFTKKNHRKDL